MMFTMMLEDGITEIHKQQFESSYFLRFNCMIRIVFVEHVHEDVNHVYQQLPTSWRRKLRDGIDNIYYIL